MAHRGLVLQVNQLVDVLVGGWFSGGDPGRGCTEAASFVNFVNGFSKPLTSFYAGRWTFGSESKFKISAFNELAGSQIVQVEMYAITHLDQNLITISQGGKELWSGKILKEPTKISFEANIDDKIEIVTSRRESLLGVADTTEYGVFLSSITATIPN
jgi:hypothetical protein